MRELQVVNGHRLTRRQREIVGLAASGLTNRAIAGLLNTSVRTVENHLYRANKVMEQDSS